MQNQFLLLQGWIPQVLDAIRRDIKNEHLLQDLSFYRVHFGNRPQNRLQWEEIYPVYEKELLKGNESLSEWVVNRWVFQHGDLYEYFAEKLSEINPDFGQIEQLKEEEGEQIVTEALSSFGAIEVFLFSVLNGVVFPPSVIEQLRSLAEEAKKASEKQGEEGKEEKSIRQLLESQQREIQRLQQKLTGVQKKYEKDTGSLKQQLKSLQQKMGALRS